MCGLLRKVCKYTTEDRAIVLPQHTRSFARQYHERWSVAACTGEASLCGGRAVSGACEATKVHFEKQPTEQPSVLSSRTLDIDDMTGGTVDVRKLGNVQERGLKKILASSQ